MTAEEQPARGSRRCQRRANWRCGYGARRPGLGHVPARRPASSISLLFPQRLASWTPDPALEIGPDAEQLAAQIDVLKEEKLLEPERAEVPEGAAQAAQG